MTKTAIARSEQYTMHLTGHGHPERPERYTSIINSIITNIPESSYAWLEPRSATESDIMLCHTPDYMECVKRDIASGYGCLNTGDTNVSEQSFETALLAAGAVITAIDRVIDHSANNAFCPVRPPGHHASSDRGMGFCIFNNIAIGARYAQKKHGIEKILIVDWDVHHGNGTQAIFYDDPSIFYFSTHQWPCYPGTGRSHETGTGKGKGFTMNCPCAMGSGKMEIIEQSMMGKLLPAMQSFKPELVLISAGFDCRIGDTIGALALSDEDCANMTKICLNIADNFAEGRLVSVLEGGYALPGLAMAATEHVRTLAQHSG